MVENEDELIIEVLEKELENKLKDFYLDKEELLVNLEKEVADTEDMWWKYFDENSNKIQKEVLNDINIKDEDIEKEVIEKTKRLKEKTLSFIKNDIDILIEKTKKQV